jgi:predicted nucleic acid-binding Zn ribbon protein
MKQSAIAAVIERNLLRSDERPSINITKCFSCGYTYVSKLGKRFCSDRCREWFDAGNPSYQQQQEWVRKPSAMSIVCQGCQKEFESEGLRCCSIDCERRYRERQENLAIMAAVGDKPRERRRCANPRCERSIPTWRNGRRIRSDTRFCSPKCADGAK